MIIVEGPDGSGKSTLVKKLQLMLDIKEVVKWNTPPESPEELEENMYWSKALVKTEVIQDRSPWITEPIYHTIERGKVNLDEWLSYLKGALLLRSKLIYCRPPIGVIKEHASKPRSPCDTPEHLEMIRDNVDNLVRLYDSFIGHLKPVLIYDWTDSEADEKLKAIEPELQKKRLLMSMRDNLREVLIRGESKAEESHRQADPKAGLVD